MQKLFGDQRTRRNPEHNDLATAVPRLKPNRAIMEGIGPTSKANISKTAGNHTYGKVYKELGIH